MLYVEWAAISLRLTAPEIPYPSPWLETFYVSSERDKTIKLLGNGKKANKHIVRL